MSEDERTPAQIARANYDRQAQETPIPAMSELQEKLNAWMGRNFGFQEDVRLALGAAEEVGELAEVLLEVGSPGDMRLALGATKAVGKIAHAALKRAQKIRGFDDKTKYLDALADAIADINIYLMNLASANRLDYGTLIARTAEQVMQRDWKAKPVTADMIAAATPSGPMPGIPIIINGRTYEVRRVSVTYADIITWAGIPFVHRPTVAWSYHYGVSGTLVHAGPPVTIVPDMVFNVVETSNA